MRILATLSAASAISVLTISPALAYVGPGVGLGVIGAIFGSIAAFFMVLAGLVWYPIKAMLRKRREKKEAASPAAVQNMAAQAADTPSTEK